MFPCILFKVSEMNSSFKLRLLFFFVGVESCQDIFCQFYTTLHWIHHKQASSDLSFGLSIAKGILKSSNYSHGARHVDICSSLRLFSEDCNVYNGIVLALNVVACEDLRVNRHLLNSMLIRRAATGKPRTLANYLADIDEGFPSRELSDVCISQVLSTKSCVISNQCMEVISGKDKSSGYHKTHQILFALLLASQNCQSQLAPSLSIRIVLADLCSSILFEVGTIVALQYPEFLRDLLLEQTLFCSLAGFTEFFNNVLINHISSWQARIGCFAATNSSQESECSQHMTGLGIAYTSLMIKHVGWL